MTTGNGMVHHQVEAAFQATMEASRNISDQAAAALQKRQEAAAAAPTVAATRMQAVPRVGGGRPRSAALIRPRAAAGAGAHRGLRRAGPASIFESHSSSLSLMLSPDVFARGGAKNLTINSLAPDKEAKESPSHVGGGLGGGEMKDREGRYTADRHEMVSVGNNQLDYTGDSMRGHRGEQLRLCVTVDPLGDGHHHPGFWINSYATDTVGELKERAKETAESRQETVQRDAAKQWRDIRVVFQGSILANDKTLTDSGLQSGNTVLLVAENKGKASMASKLIQSLGEPESPMAAGGGAGYAYGGGGGGGGGSHAHQQSSLRTPGAGPRTPYGGDDDGGGSRQGGSSSKGSPRSSVKSGSRGGSLHKPHASRHALTNGAHTPGSGSTMRTHGDHSEYGPVETPKRGSPQVLYDNYTSFSDDRRTPETERPNKPHLWDSKRRDPSGGHAGSPSLPILPEPVENDGEEGERGVGGYYTSPPMWQLAKMSDQELQTVKNFEVGRTGVGRVKWLGETDVRGLNLAEIVQIEKNAIKCYEYPFYDPDTGEVREDDEDFADRKEKPREGSELNKPAELTYEGMKPKDSWSAKKREDYPQKLRSRTEKLDPPVEFIGYDLDEGELTIKVEHFTVYDLDQDSDDDDDDDAAAGGRPKPGAGRAGGKGTGLLQSSSKKGGKRGAGGGSNTLSLTVHNMGGQGESKGDLSPDSTTGGQPDFRSPLLRRGTPSRQHASHARLGGAGEGAPPSARQAEDGPDHAAPPPQASLSEDLGLSTWRLRAMRQSLFGSGAAAGSPAGSQQRSQTPNARANSPFASAKRGTPNDSFRSFSARPEGFRGFGDQQQISPSSEQGSAKKSRHRVAGAGTAGTPGGGGVRQQTIPGKEALAMVPMPLGGPTPALHASSSLRGGAAGRGMDSLPAYFAPEESPTLKIFEEVRKANYRQGQARNGVFHVQAPRRETTPDAARMLCRSFRPCWGAGGLLVHSGGVAAAGGKGSGRGTGRGSASAKHRVSILRVEPFRVGRSEDYVGALEVHLVSCEKEAKRLTRRRCGERGDAGRDGGDGESKMDVEVISGSLDDDDEEGGVGHEGGLPTGPQLASVFREHVQCATRVNDRHAALVWGLTNALWGTESDREGLVGPDSKAVVAGLTEREVDDDPTRNIEDLDCDEETFTGRLGRRYMVSKWLEEAVKADRENRAQGGGGGANGGAGGVFDLLTQNRLEDACDVAAGTNGEGDLHLAALLCVTAGNTEARDLLRSQVDLWDDWGAARYMRGGGGGGDGTTDFLRVYNLVAGGPSTEDPDHATEHADVASNCDLGWLRGLGVHLWNKTDPQASLQAALESYNAALHDPDGSTVSFPNPWYTGPGGGGDAGAGGGRRGGAGGVPHGPRDILYQLLSLAVYPGDANEERPTLNRVLRLDGHTPDPTDASLAWHVHQVVTTLRRAGKRVTGLPDYHAVHLASQLSAAFAEQLESVGLWHWAAYVILQTPGKEDLLGAVPEMGDGDGDGGGGGGDAVLPTHWQAHRRAWGDEGDWRSRAVRELMNRNCPGGGGGDVAVRRATSGRGGPRTFSWIGSRSR